MTSDRNLFHTIRPIKRKTNIIIITCSPRTLRSDLKSNRLNTEIELINQLIPNSQSERSLATYTYIKPLILLTLYST